MREYLLPALTLLMSAPLSATPRAPHELPTRHPIWWPAGATSPEPIPFTPARTGAGQLGIARALPQAYPIAERAAWTVLVYMDGDNDLEPYVVRDLEDELGLVGSTSQVNVLAVADRSPSYDRSAGNWTGTQLFHVTEGMKATADAAMADLGERDMGDPATLTEVLSWTRVHYPSDHTLLVFWDHGWGWRPDNTLYDETDGDALDVDELVGALAIAGGVDIIGYDACLMATLEMQAALRPYAQALVASEDYVGWDGFDYGDLLAALTAQPELEPLEVATLLAQSMSKGDSRTASVVALDSRWDALEAAVDDLAGALITALPAHSASIDSARQSAQLFAGDMAQRDLYGVAEALAAQVPDAAVKRAALEVMAGLDDVTLYEWHRRPYDGAYGTSIYWPARAHDRYSWYTLGTDTFGYYSQALSLSESTRWDDMLAAWFQTP